MMRAPSRAAIYAAELRVVQARQNTRDSLGRARTALRATLARPVVLISIAGAAGVLGFWLMRRRRRPAVSAGSGAGAAATTSVLGVVLAYVMRYGKPALPFIIRQLHAARQQRAAQAGNATPSSSAAEYSSDGTRH